MLASDVTMAMDCKKEASITIKSSWWMQNLLFFPFMHKLKENLSEKISMIWELRKSSGWVDENIGKSLWDLLLVLTRWPLMFFLWWLVKLHKEEEYRFYGDPNEKSMSIWIIWFKGIGTALNYALSPSFWRWNLMGMRPVIALIPSEGDVLNAPSIQMATLLCILLRALSRYNSSVMNQSLRG